MGMLAKRNQASWSWNQLEDDLQDSGDDFELEIMEHDSQRPPSKVR